MNYIRRFAVVVISPHYGGASQATKWARMELESNSNKSWRNHRVVNRLEMKSERKDHMTFRGRRDRECAMGSTETSFKSSPGKEKEVVRPLADRFALAEGFVSPHPGRSLKPPSPVQRISKQLFGEN